MRKQKDWYKRWVELEKIRMRRNRAINNRVRRTLILSSFGLSDPKYLPEIDKLYVLLDNDEKRIADLEAQIEKMKSDVIEYFGSEYNVLVAKLLNKWEIKEK